MQTLLVMSKIQSHRLILHVSVFIYFCQADYGSIQTENSSIVAVRPEGTHYWIHPCGIRLDVDHWPHYKVKNSDLASNYALQLDLTLHFITQWIDEFSMGYFHMSYEEMCALDDGLHYPWLLVKSTIPKKIGQHLTSSHYQLRSFEDLLMQSSDVFQRFAVAWEQVVFETLTNASSFQNEFNRTRIQLRQTLCALDYVLAAKGMIVLAHPTRDIFPSRLRNLTVCSSRNVRNFRILKDYINALEYFADGFHFFQRQTNEPSLSVNDEDESSSSSVSVVISCTEHHLFHLHTFVKRQLIHLCFNRTNNNNILMKLQFKVN